MELFDSSVPNAWLTPIAVSFVIALIVAAVGYVLDTNSGSSFRHLLFATFAFSLLGFVVGLLLGDSREGVVGSIIPAVLTFIGGIAAFVVTANGASSQSGISAILICLTFSLLVGSIFEIRLRIEYEVAQQSPASLGERAVAIQRNKLAVEIQRLQDYITFIGLRDDLAKANNIDLSHFKIGIEKPSSELRRWQWLTATRVREMIMTIVSCISPPAANAAMSRLRRSDCGKEPIYSAARRAATIWSAVRPVSSAMWSNL